MKSPFCKAKLGLNTGKGRDFQKMQLMPENGGRSDIKVAIQSLGCKVNQYEALKVSAQFLKAGYQLCSPAEEADVYIMNTCTVTGVADRTSRKIIRRAAQKGKRALVVVTGCHAEAWEEFLPGVRVLKVPQLEKETLYRKVEESLFGPAAPQVPLELDYHTILPVSGAQARTKAYLKIQDGCDRFCSYCIIPFIRGRSRSRPVEELLKEADFLTENHKEIVITGICVGDYGKDLGGGHTLSSLVEKLLSSPRSARFRLSSIDPCDMDEKLVEYAAAHPRFCRHLHLALQHGSDRILRRMGRDYTAQEFFLLCRELKNRAPGIAITTDIITGFPGETERDFELTLDLARAVGFSRIHVFPYSERKGTGAARHKNKVKPEIRDRRSRTLLQLSDELARNFYRSSLGGIEKVLVEHERDKETGMLQGYTSNYIPVLLEGEEGQMGKLMEVKLISMAGEKVLGRVFQQE